MRAIIARMHCRECVLIPDGRVAQAFDFAGITNRMGAPFFAFFAKGGTRKCLRTWVHSVAR
jgi:hypothetical protein